MTSRTILVTGGSGLIGSFFLKKFSGKAGLEIIVPSHQEMDIANLNSVKRYFEKYSPESVINFAAFRNATEAEKQRGDKNGSAWKVNVQGSKNIAKISAEFNSYLIHISTDYVFSGSKKNPGPYLEKDEPNDNEKLLSWYGLTKREAERAVRNNISDLAIIRICNITREQNDPKLDYVGKILWLYDQKNIYPMFNDQYLTLTYIPALVDLITKLLSAKFSGIYHASTTNFVTPYELANYLIEQAYGLKNEIKGVSINSYLKLNPRRYPQFGGLKASFTQRKLGLKFMSWQEVVKRYILLSHL